MRKKIVLLCMQVCLLFSLSVSNSVSFAAEPFLGEVRWFAGNFAPRGWATCDGQILSIASNQSLFSLLGTNYGGDGRTTFGLPDMRGRGMMHRGNGPGLSSRQLGEKSGVEQVTLQVSELSSHTHQLRGNDTRADTVLPDGRVIGKNGRLLSFADTPDSDMRDSSIAAQESSGQPHNNMQPYIALNCIIALQGVFPSRN